MGTSRPAWLADRRRRGLAFGVAGAVIAFLALTMVQAVAVNPYLPPDELYHVSYALVVRDGRLPELTTPVPAGEVPLRADDYRPRRIYTANHPPLFYLPVSAVLRIGSPAVAFLSARLVSVAFGAAGVVMVAWLALALLPSRPRVAVGAAWFAALLPAVPHYSAFVYNDSLAFLASTAAMVAAVLAVRRGPTVWRLGALTVAAATAALTRAPGVTLVAVAGLAAALAVWLHNERPWPSRLLRAGGVGALVGGLGVASSIWFYLRNRALYGDLTGARFNTLLNHTPLQHEAARLAVSPRYVLRLFDGLWVWARFALAQIPVPRGPVVVPRALALVILAGLVVVGIRALRERLAGEPVAGPTAPGDPAAASTAGGLMAWLLVVGWLVLGFLMVAWYDGNGGRTHSRYLLPVIGVAALLAAIGLDVLPWARRGLVTLAVSLVLLGLTAAAWGRFVDALLGPRPFGPQVARGVADLVHQHGVPHAWWLLAPAALALLAALGLQQRGLWLLAGERGSGERPQPAAAGATSTRADADLRA
jgi:Dolichyl-phosphate-mannose-protein mannosyltransferase